MALGSIVVDLLVRTGSFETDTKKAERRLQEMGKTARQVGTVLGTAIAGGVTVAVGAMATWTREITELSEQTRILSNLSGTSSTIFQEWAAGSRTVGIEQDKLADILKDVQDRVGDFIQTGGGPMADFFENIAPKVGLTAEQFAKLSGPDALQAYVSALESANLTQADMVFYMEAMASDSSRLIPLLADGGEEMRRWGGAARDAGAIMSDEMVASMRESREGVELLKLAFFGMKVEVVDGITPAVQDFTDLLNDADTREGLSSLANGLVTITTKAVEAAAALGDLVGGYTDFLSNRGFLPTDGDSTLDQLEARRAKLEGAVGKADGYFGKLLYGEKTVEELRAEIAQVEEDIAAFPFRGVSGSTRTTANGQPRRGNPYDPPSKEKAGKSEAEKAAERLASAYQSMTSQLDQQITLFGEVSEAARVRYEIESGSLKGLAPEKQALLIQDAEHLDLLADIAEHEQIAAEAAEEHAAAIREQQERVGSLLSDMQFEIDLLGLSNKERERAIALRYANVDAASAEGMAIMDMADALYVASERAAMMEDVKDGLSDAFVDLASGAKSAKDAFGDFADSLFETALRFVADQAIEQMFSAMSGGGSSSGGGGGWAGFFSGLMGAFGGARAGGGPVDPGRAYLVGEQGPELIVPRAAGTVVPAMQTAAAMGGAGGSNQVLNFMMAAPTDPRTQQQIAQRVAFETDRAQRRNR